MPFGLITTRKARKIAVGAIAVGAITAEIEDVERLQRAILPLTHEERRRDSVRLNALTRARIAVQDAFASKAGIRASK